MNKFKVGDKVVREFTSDVLVTGQIYVVCDTTAYRSIKVKDESGNHFTDWFDEDYFSLLAKRTSTSIPVEIASKTESTLVPSIVVYKQEIHCCGCPDDEATAKFYLEDGGGGEYLVIDVKQWAFDKPEEIDEFCALMKQQLSFAKKEYFV